MARWPTGSHGGTYGGNPIGCAAAIATIDVLTEPGFLDNVQARGEQLRAGLRSLADEDGGIVDVRGPGLMVACQLADAARVPRLLRHCLDEGRLILMNAGTFGDAIRWMPPLVVSEAEVDHGARRLRARPSPPPAELAQPSRVRLASSDDGCGGGRRADGALRRGHRRRRRVLRGRRRARSPRCSVRTGPARPPPSRCSRASGAPTPAARPVVGLDPRADHAALTRRVGVMLQAGGVGPGVRVLRGAAPRRRPLRRRARPGRAARAGRAHRHGAAHLAPDLRRRAAPARPRPGAGRAGRRSRSSTNPARVSTRRDGSPSARSSRGLRDDGVTVRAHDPRPRRGREARRPRRDPRPRIGAWRRAAPPSLMTGRPSTRCASARPPGSTSAALATHLGVPVTEVDGRASTWSAAAGTPALVADPHRVAGRARPAARRPAGRPAAPRGRVPPPRVGARGCPDAARTAPAAGPAVT